MQPHNEFRFHPQVVQIGCYWGEGGHTELYLLQGDTLAIIDTGVHDTPARFIAPALQACGLRLEDVALILNTHGHHDHTGGNGELVVVSGAKVWVHGADARAAADPDYQFDTYFVNRHALVGRADRLDAARASLKVSAGRPTPVDRMLKDGEVIELGKGIRLRTVHTPGHTQGSVCYVWESQGIVFSGDSIMGLSSRPGGLPLIYYPAEYQRSLQRLRELDFSTLALGHHYRTLALPRDSVHFRGNANAYMEACQENADCLADAMRRAATVRPAAGFLDAARAATDLAAECLPIIKNEDGLALYGSVEAFYGAWKELGR